MAIISIPLWMFIGAVGLPSVCLIWLVVSLVRKRRKLRLRSASPETIATTMAPYAHFGRFQQDLVALQIDAVFNGLVALIETERIKLKTLIGNNLSCTMPECGAELDERPAIDSATIRQRNSTESPENDPADAEGHLGLSLAEVELAMKVQASRTPHTGRKLEAVA